MPKPRTARRPAGPLPGRRGGVCPYTDEWSDEICGAEADHFSAAINGYLCGDHYQAVKRQAAAMAAAQCEDCGRQRAACACGQEPGEGEDRDDAGWADAAG